MATALPLKLRWLLSLLAVFGLVLALACGGNDSPNSQDGMAPPDQQVLRLRMNNDPGMLDPHLAANQNEISLVKQLSSGLFTYDADLNVVPDLAAALPTGDNGGISGDGLTYRIDIIQNARWSDGTPITANDFVYSIKRALDPELASPYASFLYGIVGASEYNEAMEDDAPRPPASELDALRDGVGVRADGERTLVFELVEPNPSFLNLLTLWTTFPVKQDIVERHGTAWTDPGNHIGNGPFVLSAWERDQRIVFTPNANWHGSAPKLSRLEVIFIQDDAVAYQAYLNNELDVVWLPQAAIAEVRNTNSALRDELVVSPVLSTYALFLNNDAEPFDDARVRQAFGMAIDREAYVNGLLQGAGRPTTSWIPPGMPGFNDNLGEHLEFDAAAARKLLADAGFPNGAGLPQVTFIMVATDSNRLVGQFVQQQLSNNLGVNVQFEYLEGREYGPRFVGGDYQVTIQSWYADWPYPDNWLPTQFTTGSPNNVSQYSNPRFDDLMGRAFAAADEKTRLRLFDDAHEVLLDDAGLVPLYNEVSYTLVKRWVRDLVTTAIDGSLAGDYFYWKTFITAGRN